MTKDDFATVTINHTVASIQSKEDIYKSFVSNGKDLTGKPCEIKTFVKYHYDNEEGSVYGHGVLVTTTYRYGDGSIRDGIHDRLRERMIIDTCKEEIVRGFLECKSFVNEKHLLM